MENHGSERLPRGPVLLSETASARKGFLESRLNDFDPAVRRAALHELTACAAAEIPPAAGPLHETVNMHCHTFFSFNAHGYSPSALAWLGKKLGLSVMGIVDFDVLDGVEEFLSSCRLVGIRGSAGIETRVFVPEFSSREINSPGEPGICYEMGIGFVSGLAFGRAGEILEGLTRRSSERNREMLLRLNERLAPVSVDYERDVLPHTPKGNATERHMLAACVSAAERAHPDRAGRARFWAERLSMAPVDVETLMDDEPGFQNVIRGTLMKRGGVAYVPPGPESFPSVDEFHEMVRLLGALPCFAWLDGTSEGEGAIEELLSLMISKGAAAVNVIPDRNWNVGDPREKETKVENLRRFIRIASTLDLPVNAGTEMNRPGLKLVDDFDVPELAPARRAFIDGAYFIYGHTLMERARGMGYQSGWAQGAFSARGEKNAFYTRIGRIVPPGESGVEALRAVNGETPPDEVLSMLGKG
jgi:hypothetical protein